MDYAKRLGLDPLSSDSWYSILSSAGQEISKMRFVNYHGGNLKRVIQLAFPELAFTKWAELGKISFISCFFFCFLSFT